MKRHLFTLLAVLWTSTCAWAQSFSDGSGTKNDSYQISTQHDLEKLAADVNKGNTFAGKYFVMTSDIALSGDWTPIGGYERDFCGFFDGAGHKVTNLTITPTGSLFDRAFLGLFGSLKDGSIKNLGVVMSRSGISNGYNVIGGLAGKNVNGSITNCYAIGSITGEGAVGGLVGKNEGFIADCWAAVTVTGHGGVGGLVGENGEVLNNNISTISRCYAIGTVTGISNRIGGLAGQNVSASTITDSYATGDVTVTGENSYSVGGLVGVNSKNSKIVGCYTINHVKGVEKFGGLAGRNDGPITNCYALVRPYVNDESGVTDCRDISAIKGTTGSLDAFLWKAVPNGYPSLVPYTPGKGAPYYIITDKDGYTNLREKPTTNSKVIDKAVKYELLFEGNYFCDDLADLDYRQIPQNWIPVRKDADSPVGYVFMKNIQSFNDMNSLQSEFREVGGPDAIICSNGVLTVSLILKPFDIEKHKVERVNNNGVVYTTIDGEYPKGMSKSEYTKEACVDDREIKELIVNIPGRKYTLPVDAITNYFNPKWMTVYVGPEKELYIYIHCGTDGEPYSIMLSVVDGEIIFAKQTTSC